MKIAVAILPQIPTTPCIQNASRESSTLNIFLSLATAINPKIPPTRPMISAPPTPAEPEAGVIATRPATAPEAPPISVAFL